MKIKTAMLCMALATGLGIGVSMPVSADYSCIRECRNQYQACLTDCGSNGSCRAWCFYNYENCIDYTCGGG